MGRHFSDEAGNITYTTVQGKTLIKPLETNNWGIGVSFSSQINNNPTSEKDWTVNVPLSISMLDDHFLLHTNVGGLENTPLTASKLLGVWVQKHSLRNP